MWRFRRTIPCVSCEVPKHDRLKSPMTSFPVSYRHVTQCIWIAEWHVRSRRETQIGHGIKEILAAETGFSRPKNAKMRILNAESNMLLRCRKIYFYGNRYASGKRFGNR